jgi:hypothetical protein
MLGLQQPYTRLQNFRFQFARFLVFAQSAQVVGKSE